MRSLLLAILIASFALSCHDPAPDLEHWQITSRYDSLGRITLESDTSKWMEIHDIDDKLVVDMAYASSDNPLGRPLYECERCFLTKETALALQDYVDALNKEGFIVKIVDCYRPRRVQRIINEALYNSGSDPISFFDAMHNRGLAVDMTLLDKQGNPVDMGSPVYKEGPDSFHDNFDLPDSVQQRRRLLMDIGRSLGFQAVRHRWWQYTFRHTTALSNDYIWFCENRR